MDGRSVVDAKKKDPGNPNLTLLFEKGAYLLLGSFVTEKYVTNMSAAWKSYPMLFKLYSFNIFILERLRKDFEKQLESGWETQRS